MDPSTIERSKLISVGIDQFMKTPLLGIGAGNSVLVGIQASGVEVYLHNNYIDQLVNIGIIGTVIYYLFYMIPLKRIFHDRGNYISSICLTILLLGLILDFAMVSTISRENYFYLMIIHLQYEILGRKNVFVKEGSRNYEPANSIDKLVSTNYRG